jgi:hypothetical protein
VRGCRRKIVGLRERIFGRTSFGGNVMGETYLIILIVMTFVIPALAILGDNANWTRKK